jgi:hypothetical protein
VPTNLQPDPLVHGRELLRRRPLLGRRRHAGRWRPAGRAVVQLHGGGRAWMAGGHGGSHDEGTRGG